MTEHRTTKRANRTVPGFARSRLVSASAAVAIAIANGAGQAASYTWDSTASTPTAPVDGAGAWDLSTKNFVTGGANAAWVNVASGTGHTAIFGTNTAAAGTVTLSTEMILGGLTFNTPGSGSYTLTGGSIKALSGNITVNVNADAAIDTPIVGAASTWGAFDVNGPGVLTLTGSNTFNGPIMNINSGATVSVPVLNRNNVAGPLGQSSGGVRINNGTLRYTGSGTAASNNTIRFGTTGGTFDMAGTGVMNFSVLSNVGTSTTVSRTITLTGSTTAADHKSGYGLLQAAVPEYASPTLAKATSVRKTGTGDWYLAASPGATPYAGNTLIEQGRLGIMANNALPSSTTVVLGKAGTSNVAVLDLGPVINVSGVAGVTSYNLTVAGLSAVGNDLTKTVITNNDTSSAGHVATLTVNPDGAATVSGGAAADSAFGGLIRDGATSKVALAKAGSRTLTLTGENSYTGGTTLSGGSLRTGATGKLGTGNVTTTASGTVLELGNSHSIDDTATLTLAAGSTLKMTFASTSDASTFEQVQILNLGGTIFDSYIVFSAGNYHGYDAYFAEGSPTAKLMVVPEPTAFLGAISIGGLSLLRRRSRVRA